MRTERIGFALCGSFCNHPKILMLFEEMAESFEMVPILSENTARYDTRFGLADDLIARVERAAGRPAIRTIVEAEPFGPQNLADVLVIAPCTGNTLAKLAHGHHRRAGDDGGKIPSAQRQARGRRAGDERRSERERAESRRAPQPEELLLRSLRAGRPAGEAHLAHRRLSQLVPTIDAALRGVQLQPLLVK